MKVAIVHDWLNGMRGGERVLEVLCELFPEAPIYTLFHVKGSLSRTIEERDIRTSFIQKLPFVKRCYRNYLPLFPSAIESFDLRGFDLVISTSHCVAKGVIPPPRSLHISYVFTPMRYVWDKFGDYFGHSSWARRKAIGAAAHYLRVWDSGTADRVDHIVSISEHVAEKVKRFWGRASAVIHPPVDAGRFHCRGKKEDFYLIVSAFAPYKRLDIAIEAFNRMRLPLKVIGTGQEEKRLRRMAGPSVEFLGWRPDEEVSEFYSRARALVFPGEEDFGITPLEAMASGTPVIAFGSGGALETIVPLFDPSGLRNPAPTGVFFNEATATSLADAVRTFEESECAFSRGALREHALKFDVGIFRYKIKGFIGEKLGEGRRRADVAPFRRTGA